MLPEEPGALALAAVAGKGMLRGHSCECTCRSRRFNSVLLVISSTSVSQSVKKALRAGLLWDAAMAHVCLSFQKLKMHRGGQFFGRQVGKANYSA